MHELHGVVCVSPNVMILVPVRTLLFPVGLKKTTSTPQFVRDHEELVCIWSMCCNWSSGLWRSLKIELAEHVSDRFPGNWNWNANWMMQQFSSIQPASCLLMAMLCSGSGIDQALHIYIYIYIYNTIRSLSQVIACEGAWYWCVEQNHIFTMQPQLVWRCWRLRLVQWSWQKNSMF